MKKNIGFIGGGQMAEAMIKGLLVSDLSANVRISVCEPLDSRKQHLREHYELETVDDPAELCSLADIVILAVKPQVMPVVLGQIRASSAERCLIITIAAGLPISMYEEQLDIDQPAIVRAMPNMGALVQQAATALCRNGTCFRSRFRLRPDTF